MSEKVVLVLEFSESEWRDIIQILRHIDEYAHLGHTIAAEYKKLKGSVP